jgi:hypothetical protein
LVSDSAGGGGGVVPSLFTYHRTSWGRRGL